MRKKQTLEAWRKPTQTWEVRIEPGSQVLANTSVTVHATSLTKQEFKTLKYLIMQGSNERSTFSLTCGVQQPEALYWLNQTGVKVEF